MKQILLIHANLLNSYLLGDVIQLYKQNGYKFITLTEALENPAPAITYPAAGEGVEKTIEEELLPLGMSSPPFLSGPIAERSTVNPQ